MNKLIPSIVAWTLLGLGACQYEHGGGPRSGGPPPPSILLHKQALGQDGSFNYAFAADNGLQQGEVINPDGSRKGSYSYVDPNGKTVTLSYTAGKDGFRVLNGDHVPKAPEAHQQQQLQQRPNPHYYQQQPPPQQYQQYAPQPTHQELPRYPLFKPNPVTYEAYRSSPNAPAYRGNPVHRGEAVPPPVLHGQYALQPPHHQAPYRQPSHNAHYQPPQYSVQEGGHDGSAPFLPYQNQAGHGQEDPRKPHSFGNGYSFEFAG